MLTLLPNFFNLKKESAVTTSGQPMNRYDVLARLFYLVNNLPEDQQYIIFKNLLKSRASNYLLKMIIDMSDEQRLLLMKQLERTITNTAKSERRRYARKDCLVNVKFIVNGLKYNSYILDISPTGMFIETSEPIRVGQILDLTMTLPNDRRALSIAAEVIWSDTQGFGAKFFNLTPQQLAIIKAFAANKEAVYEIVS